jgi:hypothetical protein
MRVSVQCAEAHGRDIAANAGVDRRVHVHVRARVCPCACLVCSHVHLHVGDGSDKWGQRWAE